MHDPKRHAMACACRTRRLLEGYRVDELNEETQRRILEKHRYWSVEDIDWWDCVYDDAKNMGALMGIIIEDIDFSGFWSQGDGASFTGIYGFEPEAVQKIQAECNDEELLRIASELTKLQVTFKLEHGETYACSVARQSRGHVHSIAMITQLPNEGFDGVPYEVLEKIDEDVQQSLRSFADWIYRSLEAEYEYLTSDEQVAETITANDLRFDLDGERI